MITKEQAIELHYGSIVHYTGRHDCSRSVGPKGGIKINIVQFRVSGKCQTWKTRPNDFRLPVKFGLYESYAVTQGDSVWHLESECPLNHD